MADSIRNDWHDLRGSADNHTLKFKGVNFDEAVITKLVNKCLEMIGKLQGYGKFIDDNHMNQLIMWSTREQGGKGLTEYFNRKANEVIADLDTLRWTMEDMGDTFKSAMGNYLRAENKNTASFDKIGDLQTVKPEVYKTPPTTTFAPKDGKADPPKPTTADNAKNNIVPESSDGWSYNKFKAFNDELVGRDQAAYDTGELYIWLAGQLSTDFSNLNEALKGITAAMWEGDGADRAMKAVQRFTDNTVPFTSSLTDMGNNLKYCAEWLYDTHAALPKEEWQQNWTDAGWQVAPVVNELRTAYQNYWVAGINGAVAAMPAIPIAGKFSPPPEKPGDHTGNGNNNGNGNGNNNNNNSSNNNIDKNSPNYKAGFEDGNQKGIKDAAEKNNNGGGGGNQGGPGQGSGRGQGSGSGPGGQGSGPGNQGSGSGPGGQGSGPGGQGSGPGNGSGQPKIDKNSPEYQSGYQDGYKKGTETAGGDGKSGGGDGKGGGGDGKSGGSSGGPGNQGDTSGSNPYGNNQSNPNGDNKSPDRPVKTLPTNPPGGPTPKTPKELLDQLLQGKNPFKDLSPETMQKIGKELLGGLSPELLKKMTPEGLQKLGSDLLQNMTPEQLKKFGSDILGGLTPEGLKTLSPETLKNLDAETIRNLSPDTLRDIAKVLPQVPGGTDLLKTLTDGLNGFTKTISDVVKSGTDILAGLATNGMLGIPGIGELHPMNVDSALPNNLVTALQNGAGLPTHVGGPGPGPGPGGNLHPPLTTHNAPLEPSRLFPRAAITPAIEGQQMHSASSNAGSSGVPMGPGPGPGGHNASTEYKRGKFLDSEANLDDFLGPDVERSKPVVEP
ncbi:hypothetical protein ACIA8C_23345 [Nocardia sp. NPDC051321]|uniref:hypothetical protein n=1 Tax=Nocardia sp. NPDC051321 TaxID=3364323 RepID=UPI00378747E4